MATPSQDVSNALVPIVPAGPPVPQPSVAAPIPAAADPQQGSSRPSHEVAPPPSRSRAPRRLEQSNAQITSRPPLLLAVSGHPMADNIHPDVTMIIPSSVSFFATLAEMDQLMSSANRFTSSSPFWVPLVSQLYYGTLFYMHTVYVQSQAGYVDFHLTEFLRNFRSVYDFQSLRIAGPLVPYFQAMAASNGINDHYGNISFGIPSVDYLSVTQANFYLPDHALHFILPNIILALDQLIRIAVTLDPTNDNTSDSWYSNIYGQAAPAPAPAGAAALADDDDDALAAAANISTVMYSPNARSNPTCSQTQLQSFYGRRVEWLSTLPVDANQASQYIVGNNNRPLRFDQILGFFGVGNYSNVYYPWFTRVASIMQVYSSFFRNSVPLAAISPTGLGAVYVECQYLGTNANRDILVPRITTRNSYCLQNVNRYNTYPTTNVSFSATHPDPSLEALAEQFGLVAQLNTSWDNVPIGPIATPARHQTHFGPMTDLPAARTLQSITPGPSINNTIATYYFSATQLPLS